jgi:hypothetical protein
MVNQQQQPLIMMIIHQMMKTMKMEMMIQMINMTVKKIATMMKMAKL